MMRGTHFPTIFEDKGLDDFFEGFFRPVRQMDTEVGEMMPLMDVSETETAFLIKAEMPGIKKEDIDVSLKDGMLTISGGTKEETEEKEEGKVIRQERRYGTYVRSMSIGANVDGEHIEANYDNGVLELTLPKVALEETRKIKVDIH
jgi:HSP20 family protein